MLENSQPSFTGVLSNYKSRGLESTNGFFFSNNGEHHELICILISSDGLATFEWKNTCQMYVPVIYLNVPVTLGEPAYKSSEI